MTRAGQVTTVLAVLFVGLLLFHPIVNGGGGQSLNETAVERAVHDEVNDRRAEHGVSKLDYSEEVAAVARAHSDDMVQRDYYSHISPDGATFMDRYERHNVGCDEGGENINKYTLREDDTAESAAAQLVQQWMDSPGHRANLLNDRWTVEGIGVAVADGEVTATQNFC
jgi:uncharacterized protein YkwD